MIKNQVQHITIEASEAPQRIDNYLFRLLKNVPKSRVYRLLRNGEIRVNKKRIKPSYRLVADDILRLPPIYTEKAKSLLTPDQAAFNQLEHCILFESKELLIINKPSGVAVHAGSATPYGVIEILRKMRPHDRQLELVHRLDRDTSGCLILAKKRSMLRRLHEMLRNGQIKKEYLALLKGKMKSDERRVELALKKEHKGGERIVRVSEEGKHAITIFRVKERFQDATLARITLITGRTHQIRVHANHIGHPIAGDPKYGDKDFNQKLKPMGLKRLFLHAHKIGFSLPDLKQKIAVTANLDTSLQEVTNTLKK